MITLVIGGACSGKSEYAEGLLDEISQKKYYLATMMASDPESMERVQRHRSRRVGRDFHTLECPVDLAKAAGEVPEGAAVLLECIGNLAANELYKNKYVIGPADDVKHRILEGIRVLSGRCAELVIVSNEVNRAGCQYEGETLVYQKLIGELNQELCFVSDRVVEMVYGLPVDRKRPCYTHENTD